MTGDISLDAYDPDLIKTLIRLRDDYKWNWGLIRQQIRLRFDLNCDAVALRRMYRQAKVHNDL